LKFRWGEEIIREARELSNEDELVVSEPPEPDYEAMIEERNRPTYREEAIMDHGVEIREVRDE